MSVESKLRRYILESFLFTDDEAALDSSASFMGAGILDSTGIMEVIVFIEDEFSLSVEDHEMVPENLDSVEQIVAFVERKKSAS